MPSDLDLSGLGITIVFALSFNYLFWGGKGLTVYFNKISSLLKRFKNRTEMSIYLLLKFLV